VPRPETVVSSPVACSDSSRVKRLSVGGALSRLALAAFMKGAREMKEQGGFTWVRDAMPTRDLKAVFGA
jgi:2-methylisocitrate lyase-like PEP mutase family enzyme